MAVLFFVFIVVPLVLIGGAAVALFVTFTRFVISAQEKRLRKSTKLSEGEIIDKAVAQVMQIYTGLVVAFLLFLVVYYYMT